MPILWLACYVPGSPTYTRISTLARATLSLSLAYTTASPALSFASYLGHAPTTLTRTECFESCGESRRSGSTTAAAAAAPAPVVPISPASPIRTLLAARASTHHPPIPRRWPGLRHRSALLASDEPGVADALLSTNQQVCGSASGAAGRGRRAARLASSLRPRCSPAPFDAFMLQKQA